MTTWTLRAPDSPQLSLPGCVMGVINHTPDSFSDGGRYVGVAAAVAHGVDLVAAGADWLDVGGESSRPGAEPVSVAVECDRVVPVIAGLRAAGVSVPISVDTWKAAVAEPALAAGATMINDISSGRDPDMYALVAEKGVGLCLMHMQGTPQTMQVDPHYDDVVADVTQYLAEEIQRAVACGVSEESIVCDPGIGFGKTHNHNWQLLRSLGTMSRELARPLLLGVSRKRLVGYLMGDGSAPEQRDHASHLLHVQLFATSAIVRVHDVAGAVLARRLCLAHTRVAPVEGAE